MKCIVLYKENRLMTKERGDMLTQNQFNKMSTWMKSNACPLDLAKWNFIFHNGSKEKIVDEFLKYQNSDGGFGNRLEPDILLPDSNAITSAEALFTAYEYDLDLSDIWFKNLLNYFENSVKNMSIFWEAVPVEIENYPHPFWWSYESNAQFTPNPSAIIASALILHGTPSQKELGFKVAEKSVDYLLADEECDEFTNFCLIALINKLRTIDSPLLTDNITNAMKHKISERVSYDERDWATYKPQPLGYVYSPESEWYDCIKDGIDNNFKYWWAKLETDGAWKPDFTWGIDSEESRRATKDWAGKVTAGRAKILKNFNMIEKQNKDENRK